MGSSRLRNEDPMAWGRIAMRRSGAAWKKEREESATPAGGPLGRPRRERSLRANAGRGRAA